MEIKYCFLNLLRQKFGFFCKSDFWSILFGTSIRTAFLVSIRKFCGKTHSSTKNQLSLLFFGVWENKNFGLPAKKLPEFDGNNFDRLQKITYHIFKRTVREKSFFSGKIQFHTKSSTWAKDSGFVEIFLQYCHKRLPVFQRISWGYKIFWKEM